MAWKGQVMYGQGLCLRFQYSIINSQCMILTFSFQLPLLTCSPRISSKEGSRPPTVTGSIPISPYLLFWMDLMNDAGGLKADSNYPMLPSVHTCSVVSINASELNCSIVAPSRIWLVFMVFPINNVSIG